MSSIWQSPFNYVPLLSMCVIYFQSYDLQRSPHLTHSEYLTDAPDLTQKGGSIVLNT